MDKENEKKEKPPINTKKWLYSFKVPRTHIKEVEEERTEDGEKITVKKQKEVTEQVEIFLKRPTRKLYDNCNLFYSVKISEGVKAGLLTRPMIAKRYKNDGGGLSETEQKEFGEKYNELLLKEKEFQLYQMNLQEDRDITHLQRQDKLEEVVTEIEEIKAGLEQYEVTAESFYEHTAEARAARMTNMWWLFYLTYIKFENDSKGGIDDFMPFIAGKTFEHKIEDYELLEERIQEDDDKFVNFEATVIEKASYLIAAWNGGNAKIYEDFKKVEESLEFIREEVRKDENLQEVYEGKIRELAGFDTEMLPAPPAKKKEKPKEEPDEPEDELEEPEDEPEEPEDKPKEPEEAKKEKPPTGQPEA